MDGEPVCSRIGNVCPIKCSVGAEYTAMITVIKAGKVIEKKLGDGHESGRPEA
jgi:hypothetical protein